MFDNVEVHGHLHATRLYDTFYRRMGVIFQAVAVIATAGMRGDNQDSVVKQMKRLGEMLFPENAKVREQQEELMKDTLRREGGKSYKVEKVNLGERR
jgi:hypothetical protein